MPLFASSAELQADPPAWGLAGQFRPGSRQSSFRVLDGPIRAVGTVSIEPIGDGSRSRLTFTLDFQGHGLGGKVLLPLAKSQARKQIPKDQAKLKALLESGT